MAVGPAKTMPAPDWPAVFRGFIVRSTQHSLAKIQEAGSHVPSAERDQALHALSFALRYDKTWPAARDLLLELTPKLEQEGYREELVVFLEMGICQSQALDDIGAEAKLRLQLGILYQLQAQYDEARSQLAISAAHFESLNMPRYQARALNRLAYVARRQRRFAEAEQLVARALELLGAGNAERAYTYSVLGALALDRRSWQEAVHFFDQSLRECLKKVARVDGQEIERGVLP